MYAFWHRHLRSCLLPLMIVIAELTQPLSTCAAPPPRERESVVQNVLPPHELYGWFTHTD
eukprot:scaffold4409_cov369-Prasinococcus_capsulatus_cf.AAC.39